MFRRNIKSRAQVRALANSVREALGRARGRFSSIRRAGACSVSPAALAQLPERGDFRARGRRRRQGAERLAWLGARLIAHDLREVGITVDCLPVLDAPRPGAHDIIGDRAFSREPEMVARSGARRREGCSTAVFFP